MIGIIDPKDLPDSRTRYDRGTIWHPGLGNMSRVYCAHCGIYYGLISEEWAKKVFFMCDDCTQTYGRLPLQEATGVK